MVAYGAGAEDPVPWPDGGGGEVQLGAGGPDPRGDDVEPVALAALDHLRVPRGDRDPGARGRARHRLDLAGESPGLEPLLDDEGGREREWGGPRDRQVVHRPVDRELPDRSSGEDERAHDEGVGRQGQPEVPEGDERGVRERGEGRVLQEGQQEALYELVGRLPTCP